VSVRIDTSVSWLGYPSIFVRPGVRVVVGRKLDQRDGSELGRAVRPCPVMVFVQARRACVRLHNGDSSEGGNQEAERMSGDHSCSLALSAGTIRREKQDEESFKELSFGEPLNTAGQYALR